MNLGHLYVMHANRSVPPKIKLMICVCDQSNFFLWISTRPRQHGDGQFQLFTADHHALAHDCFLDCSRVTTANRAEMAAAHDRGVISEALRDRICDFLEEYPPELQADNHRDLILSKLASIY